MSRWNSLVTFAAVLVTGAITLAAPVQGADGDLKFSGDFRLRYEHNDNLRPGAIDAPAVASRNREVVRFRAGLSKQINERIRMGARMTTGGSGDPNTADVTLGSFVDDLEVSLDRLFLEWNYEEALLTGGKFPNPFRRTDLVWDGDVNPQGVAGSFSFSGSDQVTAKGTGIVSILDEHTSTDIPDSRMFGGQAEFAIQASDDVKITLAGGYYDYDIQSLTDADAGDTRSNNLTGDGMAYVSDFDLLDVIAVVEAPGLGDRYPLKLVGDYVKNLGAEVDEDQGFSVDLFLGKASKKNDARVRYGYSELDKDGVLAAFSNDNTTIATNYKQHTVTLDYVALDNTALNLTWYIYKLKDGTLEVADPADADDDEFTHRLRLNAVVKF